MMPFMFHPADLLMIPALIFAVWAQARVKSAYAKYAQVASRSGMTGADAALHILRHAGLNHLAVEPIPGELTDHYDPRAKVVRLSQGIYGSSSIAALGIAAHEVGHALQDAQGYMPMRLRGVIYPVASLGSTLSFPLIFIGLLFNFTGSALLVHIGIWLFSAAVAFTIITLPVEFDASRRAMRILADGGYLTRDEMNGVRAVLRAAAMTYVAAAASAVLQLLRLLIIARGRD